MNRRTLLSTLAAIAAGGALSAAGLAGCATSAGRSAPAVPGPVGVGDRDRRLVVVFLRGAVDGLNVVVPWADKEYATARPRIAIPRPGLAGGALDLDGRFGLHPALEAIHPYWRDGRLAFVHACGCPDPTRSHFDAQDYMESGTPGRKSTPDGWLNRTLSNWSEAQRPLGGLCVGEVVPRILSGAAPVANLPSGRGAARAVALDNPAIAQAFDRLYAGDDPVANAYREGLRAHRAIVANLAGEDGNAGMGAPESSGFPLDAANLARLMRRDPHVRIAFLALGGWDTHVGQGAATGQLAGRLRPLGEGLAVLARDLGPLFDRTLIVVMSEFGRTVRENGNGGTDHGHGNAMWLLGGTVGGGRVYGEWPGLAPGALHEGRDLMVTTDFRAVLRLAILRHVGLDRAAVDRVLADPGGRTPDLSGLIRT